MSGDNEPVYRPHVAGGLDEGTRRLALIASGIGLFLLVVVGGWTLGGHRGAGGEIPVIGPDPGPIKIKPVNPGGLQLTGAEPPPANDDNGGGPSLAPGPEKPDPAALQAELDAARHADAPATPALKTSALETPALKTPALRTAAEVAAPAGTAASSGPVAATAIPPAAAAMPGASMPTASAAGASAAGAPAAGASMPGAAPSTAAEPVAATSPTPPARGATAAAPAPHAANPAALQTAIAALRSTPAAAGIAVQLAAVDTAAAAHATWDRLARAHAGLLDHRAPLVLEATHGDRTFYRLRTGGFPTVAAATAFCAQLRAAGAACTIATF